MPTSRFERGAIVRYLGKTWIIWTYPRGKFSEPVALPMTAQTRPLHRSQAALNFAGRPVLVHLLDRVPLRHMDCELIGQCSEFMVAYLAASMQRAIVAAEGERVG